ncbi:MAG: DNA recombination protein RmuC [Christensenellales bacterium]|jgi:DNA recombination protein RmuC
MKPFFYTLLEPTMLLFAAILLLLIAVALLARRAFLREGKLLERLERAESAFGQQLVQAQQVQRDLDARGRREQTENIESVLSAISRALSETARSQQGQLDKFAVDIARLSQNVDEIASVQAQTGDTLSSIRESVSNADALSELRLQIDTLADSLKNMERLETGMADLRRTLHGGARSRGMIGEMQLGALLEQVLSPGQYEKDAEISGGGEVCDYALCLPAGGRAMTLLPIEAYFPQEAYERLLDALDEGDTLAAEEAGDELERSLLREVERIERLFIAPPKTTPFAVLFLPSEGLYAEALRRTALAEALSRRHRVTLAGPTTLHALLSSIRMGFQALRAESEKDEVLSGVRSEVSAFAEALTKTQKRLRQASETIEDAAKKSRSIEKRLKASKTPLLPAERDIDEDDYYEGGDWD